MLSRNAIGGGGRVGRSLGGPKASLESVHLCRRKNKKSFKPHAEPVYKGGGNKKMDSDEALHGRTPRTPVCNERVKSIRRGSKRSRNNGNLRRKVPQVSDQKGWRRAPGGRFRREMKKKPEEGLQGIAHGGHRKLLALKKKVSPREEVALTERSLTRNGAAIRSSWFPQNRRVSLLRYAGASRGPPHHAQGLPSLSGCVLTSSGC